MSELKTFRVIADVLTTYEVEVKAENETDARRKADRISMNDWIAIEDNGFEVMNVEEIENE